MLTIWGRATSSNVQAVMWCVGELDLDHIRHDVGHPHGGLDTDDFASLNPNRQIPVVRDGNDPPIWETGAILRYLAACYGSNSFWPSDPVARAQIDKWAEWGKLNAEERFTGPVFWRVVRTPPDQQDPAAIRAAVTTLEHYLAIADDQLAQHPFIAGAHFTPADIQLGHILWRYFDIDIDRRPLPHLAAYHDRLITRPAYQTHVMVDYEILRGSLL